MSPVTPLLPCEDFALPAPPRRALYTNAIFCYIRRLVFAFPLSPRIFLLFFFSAPLAHLGGVVLSVEINEACSRIAREPPFSSKQKICTVYPLIFLRSHLPPYLRFFQLSSFPAISCHILFVLLVCSMHFPFLFSLQ